ncbi:MAG TPA: hypothetical protein VK550_31200 [Polyangiaceae bacterium]|nr:hypothetical protein [Polyangiaceae bacterium]
MAEGGISTRKWHAASWLRLEGLFCAALRVPWQGAPAILDAPQKDEKRLARLCVALARSNALLTAWQALALALVEPELREAIADSEEIAKLDAVLGNAPALAAWFEQPVRLAAATELRAMLDSAVVLPAVQSASLSQWFDKPVGRLASLASEQLALQLEAHGMRALPFVLGVPSSPAFRELAAQTSAHVRRLSKALAEFPMRQLAPSLADRWIADLYMEGRYLGRARSDVVPRGDASETRVRSAESVRGSRSVGSRPAPIAPPRPASIAPPTQSADELAFGDDVREPIVERAIDEEWITLADLHASLEGEPRVELPRPEPEIALIRLRTVADVAAPDRAAPSASPSERANASLRSAPARERPAQERRASSHVGLAIFAGVLAGSATVAMFMAVEGQDDRRPMPSATWEPPAVVALVTKGLEPAQQPTASAAAMAAPIDPSEAQPGSAGSGSAPSPLSSTTAAQIASPAVMPKIAISKTCDLALFYAQRGEIAQAIRRFDSCLSPEREWVRQQIGQRGAAEVRAKAEKGRCDEAGAIVAQVENIEAAGAAKVAFGALCDSRAREVENETAGP